MVVVVVDTDGAADEPSVNPLPLFIAERRSERLGATVGATGPTVKIGDRRIGPHCR